ncbi:UvrD-helicase domain-containing protein [Flavobacterium sp. Arc3]|uniref:UvrD-helicase domain-containing protein n=1 Tax=Flavobacterium sp. Arc3 TaxID=3046686 RepID=UPI00352E8860
MRFEITDDNRPYLEARGRIVLNACPGSGKTSAIAYKLTQLTEECARIHGEYAGIACLSFTNVAKDEIAEKFESISNRRLAYPHLNSTIDSFINQYITLPFYHLFNVPSRRPSILNTVSFLDGMNLGWFKNLRNQPLSVSYPPSKLKFEFDGSISWDGSAPNPAIVDAAEFSRFAKKFKEWQYKNGYLNNDDSAFFAYKLLEKYPEIAKSLVKRFPYIIVDEAQDTSGLQYKIFDKLIEAGLENFELVGDPYQSLYEFREAEPALFVSRFEDTKNWQALRFNNCRRSSQRIIDAYSMFRNVKEASITATGKHETDHNLKVIRYDDADLPALIEKYRSLIDPDGKNYILVRGGTHLEQFGVKTPSENPWKNGLSKMLIEVQLHFTGGNSKACIDALRVFYAEITVGGSDYKTKNDEVKRLKDDTDLNIQLFDFLLNMPSIDDTLEDWTTKSTAYIKATFGKDVNLELKKKGKVYVSQNLKNLLYSPIDTPYPISTIHKVKGMTFSSVMVVLSKDSKGANFSLHDFKTPAALPDEKQRMLYVALSRPETLACIAVPNVFTEEQISSHLGIDIEFI